MAGDGEQRRGNWFPGEREGTGRQAGSRMCVGVGEDRVHTRTVLRTLTRRGKSDTPESRVSTDDSRNFRDERREETQSA